MLVEKIHRKGDLILCTGGWGIHFNTGSEAHAVYAKKLFKGIRIS